MIFATKIRLRLTIKQDFFFKFEYFTNTIFLHRLALCSSNYRLNLLRYLVALVTSP